MPKVPYQAVVSHPQYAALSTEDKLKTAENYWNAFKQERPDNAEFADNALADAKSLVESSSKLGSAYAPIQRERARAESEALAARVALNDASASGRFKTQEEFDAARQATQDMTQAKVDRINKLGELYDDAKTKPIFDLLESKARGSALFGPTSLTSPDPEQDKLDYANTRARVAENYGIAPEQVDDIVRHRVGAYAKPVSMDVLGKVHVKDEILLQDSAKIRDTIQASDLPEKVRTKEATEAPLRAAAWKQTVIDRVQKTYPELSADIKWTGNVDNDFRAIAETLNTTATGAAGMGAAQSAVGRAKSAELVPGSTAGVGLGGVGSIGEENIQRYGESAASEKKLQAINELSDYINGSKTRIWGTPGATVGAGLYSVAESIALGAALPEVGTLVLGERVTKAGKLGKALLGFSERYLNTAPIAGIYAVDQGLQTFEQAKSTGMSDEAATNAAVVGAANEFFWTTLFGGVKLGGTEDLGRKLATPAAREAAGKTIAQTMGQIGKGVLKTTAEENLEEGAIAAVNTLFVESQLNPNLTTDDLKKSLYDTLVATTLSSGLSGGGVETVQALAERRADKATAGAPTDTLQEEADAIAQTQFSQQGMPTGSLPTGPATPGGVATAESEIDRRITETKNNLAREQGLYGTENFSVARVGELQRSLARLEKEKSDAGAEVLRSTAASLSNAPSGVTGGVATAAPTTQTDVPNQENRTTTPPVQVSPMPTGEATPASPVAPEGGPAVTGAAQAEGQAQVTPANSHSERRDALETRAKALGSASLSSFNSQTVLKDNPTEEEKALLADYAEHNSTVRAEIDPQAIAGMQEADYNSWQKTNLEVLANDMPLNRKEQLVRVEQGMEAARLRGDTRTEERLKQRLDTASKRTDYTVEELNSNLSPDEDPATQEEVDTLNSSNADFNDALAATKQKLFPTPSAAPSGPQQPQTTTTNGQDEVKGQGQGRQEVLTQPVVAGEQPAAAPQLHPVARPVKDSGKRLYRETNVRNALEFLSPETSSDMSMARVFMATDKDLALGQGDNRGLMLEIDPANLRVKSNTSKPGMAFAEATGGATEQVGWGNTQAEYQESVRAVEYAPADLKDTFSKRMMSTVEQRLLSMGWTRTETDGRVRLERPQFVEQQATAAPTVDVNQPATSAQQAVPSDTGVAQPSTTTATNEEQTKPQNQVQETSGIPAQQGQPANAPTAEQAQEGAAQREGAGQEVGPPAPPAPPAQRPESAPGAPSPDGMFGPRKADGIKLAEKWGVTPADLRSNPTWAEASLQAEAIIEQHRRYKEDPVHNPVPERKYGEELLTEFLNPDFVADEVDLFLYARTMTSIEKQLFGAAKIVDNLLEKGASAADLETAAAEVTRLTTLLTTGIENNKFRYSRVGAMLNAQKIAVAAEDSMASLIAAEIAAQYALNPNADIQVDIARIQKAYEDMKARNEAAAEKNAELEARVRQLEAEAVAKSSKKADAATVKPGERKLRNEVKTRAAAALERLRAKQGLFEGLGGGGGIVASIDKASQALADTYDHAGDLLDGLTGDLGVALRALVDSNPAVRRGLEQIKVKAGAPSFDGSTIRVSATEDTERTLTHETTHAVLDSALDNDEEFRTSVGRTRRLAAEAATPTVKTLLSKARAAYDRSSTSLSFSQWFAQNVDRLASKESDSDRRAAYALTGNHEFLAALMSDNDFRAALEATQAPRENRSLLQRFFDAIRALFGRTSSQSLLDRALKQVESAIRNPNYAAGPYTRSYGRSQELRPEIADDLAMVGSQYILDGAKSLEDFTKRLVADFGDAASAHAQAVYGLAQGKLDTLRKSQKLPPSPAEVLGRIPPEGLDALTDKMVFDLVRGYLIMDVPENQVLQRVLEDLQEFIPGLTYDQVSDAYTGYGKAKFPSDDELKTRLWHLREVGRKERQLREIKAGKRPLPTGLQRRTPTDAIRELDRQIKDHMKAAKLEGGRGIKSPLEAIKTRLRNQIRDLENALTSRKPFDARPKTPYDIETEALRKQRDELKQRYDEAFTTPDISDDERLSRATAAVDAAITREESLLFDGVFENAAKTGQNPLTDPAYLARRKYLKELRKTRAEAARAMTPEQIEARELERAIKSLRERNDYNSAILASGKLPTRLARPQKFNPNAEFLSLLRESEELEAAKEELRKSERPKSDPEAAKESAALKAIAASEKRINDDMQFLLTLINSNMTPEQRAAALEQARSAAKAGKTTADAKFFSVRVAKERRDAQRLILKALEKQLKVRKSPEQEYNDRRIAAAQRLGKHYEDLLRNKIWTKPERPERKLTDEAERAVFEAFQRKQEYFKGRAEALFKRAPLWKKVGYYVGGALGFLKFTKLCGDLGTFLRNVAYSLKKVGSFEWTSLARNIWKALRAGGDSDGIHALAIYNQILSIPEIQRAVRELDLRFNNPLAPEDWTKEDYPPMEFVTWMSKKSGLLLPAAKLARLALRVERINTTYLNINRAEAYLNMSKAFSGGRPLTTAELRGAAVFADVMTGRATLRSKTAKQFEVAIPAANHTLFISARYTLSQVQFALGVPIWTAGSMRQAARIAKQAYFDGLLGRAMLLAATSAAYTALASDDDRKSKWKLGWNPNDPDFLKFYAGKGIIGLNPFKRDFLVANFGKTTVDYNQSFVPFLNFAMAATFRSMDKYGKPVPDKNLSRELSAESERLLLRQCNIVASNAWRTFVTREYYGKEPVTAVSAAKAWLLPVIASDLAKIYQKEGPKGVLEFSQMFMGANVRIPEPPPAKTQSYESFERELRRLSR